MTTATETTPVVDKAAIAAQKAAEKATKDAQKAAEKATKDAAAAAVKAEKAAKAEADKAEKATKAAAAVAFASEEAKAKALQDGIEKMQAIEKVKADKEAAKAAAAEAKAKKAADKVAADAAKVAEKAAKVAAKEANKQPVQNDIRRPGAAGKCGQAWALMDTMSKELGAPVAIADLLVRSTAAGLNPSMTRSNYAVWRKFNGVVGRVVPVAKQQAAAAAAVAAAPAPAPAPAAVPEVATA